MPRSSIDDEFEDDDALLADGAWGSQEEESLKALEASYATQHAAGPSNAHKSSTTTARSVAPPFAVAKQPLPRGQLNQVRALESLQEEDEAPQAATGDANNKKKPELLMPSSPPSASFHGGFEPGDPWSMPHGTEAMRSMYLGLPSPNLTATASPAPAPIVPAANNNRRAREQDTVNDAPAAKRAKLAPVPTRPLKRVTSLPVVAAFPSSSSLLTRRPLAALPGPDEVVISHVGRRAGGRVDELDLEDLEEDWGDEESLRKLEEEAVAASQRGFTRTQSGGCVVLGKGAQKHAAVQVAPKEPPAAANLRGVKETGQQQHMKRHTNGIGTLEAAEVAKMQGKLKELQDSIAARDAQLKEAHSAKQRAEGEIATVRRKAAGFEARVVELERSKSETEREARLERERLLKEMHEERQAAESSAAFGHINTANGRPWVAGGSLRRRAPTSVVRGEAGPSASAARKAGLTTPTRRGRGNEAAAALRSSGSRDEETSPSQRKGARLGMSKTLQAPPAIPFPRLNNSFAAGAPTPARQGSSRPELPLSRNHTTGASSSSTSQEATSQLDAPPAEAVPAPPYDGLKWSDVRARYPEARATYARKRQALLSLLLSHTPAWASAPGRTEPEETQTEPADRTLQRLLTASLPSWTTEEAKAQLERAKPRLLALLSSNDDGATRFAFLLQAQQTHHTGAAGGAQTQVSAREAAEEDFWAMEEACDEGLADLMEGVAATLRSLLQCFFVARMHERIMDILSLIASLSYAHASFVQTILAPESAADLLLDTSAARGGTGAAPGESTQIGLLHTQAAGTSPRANALAWLVLQLVKLEPADENEVVATSAGAAETGAVQDAHDWNLNVEAREELLACIVEVLEALAWVVLEHEFGRLRPIFDSPGIKATFLSAQRRPETLRRVICVLRQLSNKYPNSVTNLLSCPLDKAQQRSLGPRIAQSRTPLFDILALHLVDVARLAHAPLEAHHIHVDILMLLSQLAVRYADLALVISESSAVLCALVRRLHEDTAAIWHDDGVGIDGVNITLDHIVTRICMSVRLLAQLYTYPERPPNLMKRLASDECNAIYNGARHAYILALGRTAFSVEPDWVDAENVKRMESVTALAVSLSELVLNPEEIDSVWTLCANPDVDEAEVSSSPEAEAHTQGDQETLLSSQAQHKRVDRMQVDAPETLRSRGGGAARKSESMGLDVESAIVLDEDEDAEEAMRGGT